MHQLEQVPAFHPFTLAVERWQLAIWIPLRDIKVFLCPLFQLCVHQQTVPRTAARPGLTVALLQIFRGDYDFQFLIEELAVGAQFNLPYIHILLNNAYLGLIRQSQRAFDIDYCVQLSFENINAPEINGYGVDHKAVVEGLGCKAIRVFASQDIAPALQEAQRLRDEFHVPVVVEIITERVTNIAMGPDINKVTEFEEILDL